jgi:alkylhydroperoxidase family enzyme
MTDSTTTQYRQGADPARTEDPARRTAAILGNGPRLLPVEIEGHWADLHAILVRMAQVNAALDSRDKKAVTDLLAAGDQPDAADPAWAAALSEIVLTMARHPGLFAVQTDIGIQLLAHGALAARDRELAVLRIGWLCQAPYEWGEHVLVAKSVGISTAEIERITHGAEADGWTVHDRAILRATEELYRDAMISDATWETLAATLDERQLIELPILVGQYQTVAYYQNALRLRLHDGNAGLVAR